MLEGQIKDHLITDEELEKDLMERDEERTEI
jgi:hypothetical protein